MSASRRVGAGQVRGLVAIVVVALTTFNLAAGKAVAGVQSSCPSIIKSFDILPRAVPGGSHMSIFWSLSGLSFAN